MKVLVLDDSVSRLQQFDLWLKTIKPDIVMNVDDALNALEKNHYDLVFLDHDLGYGAKAGSEMTRFWRQNAKNYSTQSPTVVVHTSSDVGASRMINDLEAIEANVIRKPFYMMSAEIIDNVVNQLKGRLGLRS